MTNREVENGGLVHWVLSKSHIAYLHKWILSDYGNSYENLSRELAGFIWEYGDKQGKINWVNDLSKRYQVEYRRNVTRFNLYDAAAERMTHNNLGADTLLEEEVDHHGFTTMGDFNKHHPGEILGEESPAFEAGASSEGAALSEDPTNRYYFHVLNALADDDNTFSSDGKDLGSSRHKLRLWLSKRTDQELDIIKTWSNLAPVEYADVAAFCGVERGEVERVINLVNQFGYRHRGHLNKSERYVEDLSL